MGFGSDGPDAHYGSVDTQSPGAAGPWPGFGAGILSVGAANIDGVANAAARVDHVHQGVHSVNGAFGDIVLTGFPGFGGAPPAVASASNAGVAATASRSDHTHALDVVAYNPSLAGMQASGVMQQIYGAPTATPAVLNVAADLIPFGIHAGTGVLTTSPHMFYATAATAGAGAFGFTQAQSTATAATVPNSLVFIHGEGTLAAFTTLRHQTNSSASPGAGPSYSFFRSRGTFGAQTVVAALDFIGSHAYGGHDGTSLVQSVQVNALVDGTAAIALHVMPINWTVVINQNTLTLGPIPVLGVTYQMDVVLGNRQLVQGATAGFVYYRSIANAPTGVPSVPSLVDNNVNTASLGIPSAIDVTNRRFYGYLGGAWHFAPFTDLAAVANQIPYGLAAGTLTSSADFTFNAGSLVVGNGAATALIDLQQLGGGGNIQSSTGDLIIKSNPGVSGTNATRISGGTGNDTLLVYQDYVSMMTNLVTGNVSLFASRPAMQGGQNIVYIHDRNAAPTGNPGSGGYLWSEAGEHWWRSSGGGISQLTPISAVANGVVVVALGAFGPAGASATPTRWKKSPDGAGGFFTTPSYT